MQPINRFLRNLSTCFIVNYKYQIKMKKIKLNKTELYIAFWALLILGDSYESDNLKILNLVLAGMCLIMYFVVDNKIEE